MTNGDPSAGLTLKELILRLDAKIDSYISAHEQRHSTETAIGMQMASDPAASAMGRAILQQLQAIDARGSSANTRRIEEVSQEVVKLRNRVETDRATRDAVQGERRQSRLTSKERWALAIALVGALLGPAAILTSALVPGLHR